MCGIIGAVTRHPENEFDGRFSRALQAMHHRGPDFQRIEHIDFNQSTCSLGHARLSIIDLSDGASQPMTSIDHRYKLVFNGEIYNYLEIRSELTAIGFEFRTDSDTEVLLNAWIRWGIECLVKLKGMFAFVIADLHLQKLTCVRDAFGIKPLFYTFLNDTFYFASEIGAITSLLGWAPKVDKRICYEYLVFGVYDHTAETFLEGVRQLPPAHSMSFDIGANFLSTPERWWWPDINQRSSISIEEAAAQLREMFLENVSLHMRSDVPLGAALSGGLDSSAIVCAMRYIHPSKQIHTFSYISQDSDRSEERWVDIVNQYVNAKPHKVYASSEKLANDIDMLLSCQGEPFGGASIYAQFLVYEMAKENGITVTLDGQGADELLAGYNGFPGSVMLSLIEQGRVRELFAFLWKWSRNPERSLLMGVVRLGEKLVPPCLRPIALRFVGRDPTPKWIDMENLIAESIRPQFTSVPKAEGGKGRRLMESLRNALTVNYLASLLRHGDRNSMYWSVESRVPFLTIDMAEFLLSLPEHYLVSPAGETKRIFKIAMRGIVPDEVLNRKDKIGFEAPDKIWLRELQGSIAPRVKSGLEKIDFVDVAPAMMEVERVFDQNIPYSKSAWRLINMGLWAADTLCPICDPGDGYAASASVTE